MTLLNTVKSATNATQGGCAACIHDFITCCKLFVLASIHLEIAGVDSLVHWQPKNLRPQILLHTNLFLGEPYLNLWGSLSTIRIRFFHRIVFLFEIVSRLSYQDSIRVDDRIIETPIWIKPKYISILFFESDRRTAIFLDSGHYACVCWLSIVWILIARVTLQKFPLRLMRALEISFGLIHSVLN